MSICKCNDRPSSIYPHATDLGVPVLCPSIDKFIQKPLMHCNTASCIHINDNYCVVHGGLCRKLDMIIRAFPKRIRGGKSGFPKIGEGGVGVGEGTMSLAIASVLDPTSIIIFAILTHSICRCSFSVYWGCNDWK